MIDSNKLLTDLQNEVTKLIDDLRARCDAYASAFEHPLMDEARAKNS